jgi:hypothetical protein
VASTESSRTVIAVNDTQHGGVLGQQPLELGLPDQRPLTGRLARRDQVELVQVREVRPLGAMVAAQVGKAALVVGGQCLAEAAPAVCLGRQCADAPGLDLGARLGQPLDDQRPDAGQRELGGQQQADRPGADHQHIRVHDCLLAGKIDGLVAAKLDETVQS